MYRVSFFIAALLTLFTRLPAYAVDSTAVQFTQLLLQYDEAAEKSLDADAAPGAAIAIVRDGRVVYIKSHGVRRVGSNEMVDQHTVFRIASLSKGFASILTGLLVDENKLGWDDPAVQYVRSLVLSDSLATEQLTVRHILSHTSGLPPYAYDDRLEAGMPLDFLIRSLRDVPMSCEVGNCYSYQNVVYSLIGDIIHASSGVSYNRLLQERIFKPLGMRTASVSGAALMANENRASPHVRRRWGWTPTRIEMAYYNALPAAGINASITDMAQWLCAVLGGMPDVIPPRVIAKVSEPQIRTRRERWRYGWWRRIRRAHYGMGWRIFNYTDEKLVFHSGGLRGYRSQIAFLPDRGVGIVLLINAQKDYGLVPLFLDMYLKQFR
jgi:beta-lactamase class C